MLLEHVAPGDFDDLLWIMAQESGGQVNATNPTSTAGGVYQLLRAQYDLYPHGEASLGDAVEECQGGDTLHSGPLPHRQARARLLGEAPLVLNALAAMLAAVALPTTGPGSPQAFSRYPAAVIEVARRPPVQLRSALSRRYRTDLQEAATEPVNFAGRYVLTSVGCGAGCVQVAAIDVGAGSVTWLPPTVCCWPLAMTEPLEYRRDSRLLIVHGALNEKGSGVHAFVFDGWRFRADGH